MAMNSVETPPVAQGEDQNRTRDIQQVAGLIAYESFTGLLVLYMVLVIIEFVAPRWVTYYLDIDVLLAVIIALGVISMLAYRPAGERGPVIEDASRARGILLLAVLVACGVVFTVFVVVRHGNICLVVTTALALLLIVLSAFSGGRQGYKVSDE